MRNHHKRGNIERRKDTRRYHFALYFVGIREGQEKIPSMEKYGGSKKGKI
jgi:hypothetical protein